MGASGTDAPQPDRKPEPATMKVKRFKVRVGQMWRRIHQRGTTIMETVKAKTIR